MTQTAFHAWKSVRVHRQLHVPAVSPDSHLTNEYEYVLKSTVQGCAGDVDGILGCPACVSGHFLENKVPHMPDAL